MKFSDTPTKLRPQRPLQPQSVSLCSHKQCLLHWLRTEEWPGLRPHLYRRGTILIEQGDSVLHCYSICHGLVKVARRTVRGKVFGIDLRGPGELLGARELLAGATTFDVYAQTLSETKAVRLDRTYLLDVIQRRLDLALEVSCRVAQAFGAIQRRLSQMPYSSLEEKIAYLLSYLHEKQTFVQVRGGGAELLNDRAPAGLFSQRTTATTISLP